MTADETDRIRPLTAPEWHGLLSELSYTLRVTDGTAEGSWYFWQEDGRLQAQRFICSAPKTLGTTTLADVLEGDTTTQLVKRTNETPDTTGTEIEK